MGDWLRRLAIVSVLGFPAAVLGYRFGLFEFGVAFKMISWTVMLAFAVFLLAIIVAYFVRNSHPEGSRASRQAALLCLLPLIGIGSQIVTGSSVPEIHNITTDPSDPPKFNAIVALRGDSSNPLAYDAEVLRPLQETAYPDVKTLLTDDDVDTAFQKAVKIAQDLGWDIVARDQSQGIIEATETTALWNFADDIVIRIQNTGEQTAVDLRSVSRIGRSDLGANAKRIKKFLRAYAD